MRVCFARHHKPLSVEKNESGCSKQHKSSKQKRTGDSIFREQ